MSSSFGRIFRVTTWGESHGRGLGAVVEGCPPGIPLDEADLQVALDRRRPGQSVLTTSRGEPDRAEIYSGVFEGKTTGTPISLVIHNQDADSTKYAPFKDIYRPSHADYTYDRKYGHRDWRGGGRASARETAARVAAGVIAEKVLSALAGVEIVAWVDSVGEITAEGIDPGVVTRADVDATLVRCPDVSAAAAMEERITEVRRQKETIGGCVRCVARGVPAGWGEPIYDKLTATLAHAMMSLPATRGFEMGTGFAATDLLGSQHNDIFEPVEGPAGTEDRKIRTRTNHSGGIQGGISNGEHIWFRVAFKPVATIFLEQETVNAAGEAVQLKIRGRHDPCVLPRAVPIVEAMCALTLVDAALVHNASAGLRL